MRPWELFWKVVVFGLVTVVLLASGLVVLGGNHAYNDYLNAFLGWTLVAFGVLTGGFGTLSIAASLAEARAMRAEHALHVTPRSGPPTTPPPWGMSDVGRPGVVKMDRMDMVGAAPGVRGGVKVMGLPMRHLDVPIVVGFLLIWTLVACIILAPH